MSVARKSQQIASKIEALIRTQFGQSDNGFPSVRALAAQLDTSAPTVVSALKQLSALGILYKPHERGSRYRVSALRRDSDESRLTVRLGDHIREDVIRGHFIRGRALPPRKELCRRYSCGYVALDKALKQLRSEELLIKRSAKHFVRSSRTEHPNPSSQVYVAGRRKLAQAYQNNALALFGALEREVQSMGWGRLRYFLSDDPEHDQARPDNHVVAGYIYLAYGESPWGAYFRDRPDVPLVFIDLQNVEHSIPPTDPAWYRYPRHKLHFRLTPDSYFAGAEIGQHLAATGHRHIAFFTHVPLVHGWAVLRYRGLGAVYSPNETLTTSGRTMCTQAIALTSGEHGHTGPIRSALSTTYGAFNATRSVLPEAVKDGMSGCYSLLHLMNIGSAAAKAFDTIVKMRHITAWVCINDDLAIAALHFLRQRGHSAGDIALASFDNSPQAYSLGITSYDPALADFGYTAIRCLERPELMRKKNDAPISIPGHLIVRNSTPSRG